MSSEKPDYLDLVSHVETLLRSMGRKYFSDPRKEVRALNEFMMLGKSAEDILDLIQKLVLIRREYRENSLLRSDTFWMNATENIAGALSYWQKIETVFEDMFLNSDKTIAQVAPRVGKETNPSWQGDKKSEVKNLPTFFNFCNSLPASVKKEIQEAAIVEIHSDPKRIKVTGSDKAWQYVELYFRSTDWVLERIV